MILIIFDLCTSEEVPETELFYNFLRDSSRGFGLKNLGNTCYLNATIHALIHTPSFVQWLHVRRLTHSCSGCLECKIFNIYKESQVTTLIKSNTNIIINPSQIYKRLNEINPNLTAGNQEDAHEFLMSLITVLNRPEQPNRISSIFAGDSYEKHRCLKCYDISFRMNEQEFFEVPIYLFDPNINSIMDGISKHFRDEYRDLNCSNSTCSNTHKKLITKFIEKPP